MAEEKDNNVWPSGYSEAKTIDEFDYLMTGKNGAPLTKFNKDKYKQYLSTTGQRMKAVSSGVLPAGPADKEMYMVLESSGTWTFGGNTFVNVEYQILTLWWNKNTWSVENIHLLPRGKDGRDIMDWEAKPYAFSSSVPKVSFLVFKDGIIWENNAATVAGDVPGISPKWILKTGVSIATSISSNGKNPISQEGVYKFVNGAKEFVFGSDLNKYDKIYSSNPVTVVMDYIYQEDTYTNPIYIKALVEGNISIKVFNNVNGLLTVVYDFIYSLISGVNIVNLDFPMKKGYMIGASWNNTTKTGRIAGSATDVNSKFYAISNEPTSTTISTIVSDFGIGMDFVAQKKGLPIIGKIRHSIFKSFITGSGNLLPDYTSNPDYLTLTFTSGDQRVNATGNYSPNGKSSILKFRVKSSIDNTILTVGRFASAGIPPLTYHVNVGTVEKYFELEILGNVADNISIGIVSAKNVGQVVQLKVLEIDEIKNTEDLVKDIQPQQESYAITSSVRYPLLGTSIATSGYLSTVKMPMDIGDIGEYGINVAPTASASEVFQVLFEPESGLARSPIVFERNNLNSFVEGKYKATEKGYLIVTNIRAVESQIRTAYARIVKHSKILTSNDLNIDIVTKDQYKKSSLHNLNIGFTYLIDAHFNYPNDNYNRFDHVNILPFNGELVAICQRFGNNGGDYAFSQIVVYSSSDLGASWRFLAAKPVTSANAEANPVSVLNNDGTIEIFFLKQVTGNAPRPLWKVQLNKDLTFTNETLIYTPTKTNAPGGTPIMIISGHAYITFYEGVENGSTMQTRIFKYNLVDKNIELSPVILKSTLAAQTGTEESGLYELPDGRWVCYYRTNTNWCLYRISDDNGVTWGPESRLFRATWTMSAVKKLNALTSKLKPIYVAVVNEWTTSDSSWYNNTPSQRRYLSLMVSVDGINFSKLGDIYRDNGKYAAFEPTISEVGGNILIGWSTMPPSMGGNPPSQGGCLFNTVIPLDRVLNWVNGYHYDISK